MEAERSETLDHFHLYGKLEASRAFFRSYPKNIDKHNNPQIPAVLVLPGPAKYELPCSTADQLTKAGREDEFNFNFSYILSLRTIVCSRGAHPLLDIGSNCEH